MMQQMQAMQRQQAMQQQAMNHYQAMNNMNQANNVGNDFLSQNYNLPGYSNNPSMPDVWARQDTINYDVAIKPIKFFILDDIMTLLNKDASWVDKSLAALNLSTFYEHPGVKLKFGEVPLKYISKPYAKVFERSEETYAYLRKELKFTEKQIKQFKDVTKNNCKILIQDLPDGGKFIQTLKPGHGQKFFAVYHGIIDKEGKLLYLGKVSTDSKGYFLHGDVYKPIIAPKIYNWGEYWKMVDDSIKGILKKGGR